MKKIWMLLLIALSITLVACDDEPEPEVYDITYNVGGGSIDINGLDQVVEHGKSIQEPSVTKTGYELVGWYSDYELTQSYTFETMPAENITLYARWVINQYTITFETNGGTAVVPTNFCISA